MNRRTYKMKKNVTANIIMFILSMVMSFLARTIFIKTLGEISLGLSSLYTNILSMLNLSELGLSTAIGFSLYKKLADKSYEEIGSLMTFYKKVYRIIGISILIVGLMLLPFLHNFIKDSNVQNYQLIFILYLLDVVVSYFVCYKDVLLESDQNGYTALKVKFFSMLLMYTAEIIILLTTENFVLYSLVFLITNNLGKILLNLYISNKYKYIDFNSSKSISKNDKTNLVLNVKAMIFHKIGEYLVNSTDNLIISKMINLATVGLYVNYLSLVSILKSLISTVYGAIISSVGNLIVTESDDTSLKTFKLTEFVSFLFGGLFTICFYNCANSFVEIWIGNKYVLSDLIVLIISINFYLYCMLLPVNSFKSAAGLYDVDKYYAILQAVVNLIVSIVITHFYGLIGVLIGTTVSYISTVSWIKPYVIYKNIFKKNSKEYYIRQAKYIIEMFIIFIITRMILNNLIINQMVLNFIIAGVISTLIYIIVISILNYKTFEFNYIKNILKNKLFH